MEDFIIIIVIKFSSIFFFKVSWLVAFQSVIDSGQVLLHYFVEILSKLVPNFLPRILLVSSWKGDFTSCSCSSLLRKRTLVQILWTRKTLWSRSYQRISNAQRQWHINHTFSGYSREFYSLGVIIGWIGVCGWVGGKLWKIAFNDEGGQCKQYDEQ